MRALLPVALAVVLAVEAGSTAEAQSPEGIVVESVRQGSTGARAGLESGDVLLSWQRKPAPPVSPSPAQGLLASPFDLMDVWIEQVPRGDVVLSGRRGERERTWLLRQGSPSYWFLADGTPSVWEEREVVTAPVALGDSVALWVAALRARDAARAGRFAEADRLYGELVAPLEKEASPVAAHLLRQWGNTLLRRRQAKAAECYRRALAIDRERSPQSLAAAWSLTGLGYEATQNRGVAEGADFHRQALALRQQLAPGSADLAVSWYGLALDAPDRPTTRRYLHEALTALERVVPGSVYVAEQRAILGLNRFLQQDLRAAEAHFRRALGIAWRQAPEDANTRFILHGLGQTLAKQGKFGEASRHLEQALLLGRKLGSNEWQEASLLHDLGQAERRAGRLHDGGEHLCRAVDVAERYARRFEGDRAKRTSLAVFLAESYRSCTAALVEAKREEQAVEILERGRARAFLRLVAERGLRSRGGPAFQARREQLNREYDQVQAALQRLREPAQRAEIERLSRRRDAIYEEKEQLLAREVGFEQAKTIEPLSLAGMRRVLAPGSTLVSFAVTTENTYVFVIHPSEVHGRGLVVRTLPVGGAELRRRIEAFRNLLQNPASPRAEIQAQGKALYDRLLLPIESDLAPGRSLLLSPDGPLRALPFAALVRQGRFLVEWKPLTTVISATVYGEIRAKEPVLASAGRRLVAFADPDSTRAYVPPQEELAEILRRSRPGRVFQPLPGARREVDEIAALFPQSRIYWGAAATEDAAKRAGREADVLHFAAHGVLDERNPLGSGLALSSPRAPSSQDNGLLQGWEIVESMPLDAELVTLSACNTALGTEMDGEGLVGVAWAFQSAGARSVLATLWSIEDGATASLMKAFYTGFQAGQAKAEALREAQLRQIGSGIHSHPYYWAAFQLLGDGR